MATQTRPAPALKGLRVVDVMHPGVIACPFETTLPTVQAVCCRGATEFRK